MISISKDARIFLYGKPIDLRYGFDGLAFFAQSEFKNEMLPNTFFVFINPRRTRMKILHSNGTNLVLWYFRLRKGVFFPPGNLSSIEITSRELKMIIKGQTPKHLFCPQNISKR